MQIKSIMKIDTTKRNLKKQHRERDQGIQVIYLCDIENMIKPKRSLEYVIYKQ